MPASSLSSPTPSRALAVGYPLRRTVTDSCSFLVISPQPSSLVLSPPTLSLCSSLSFLPSSPNSSVKLTSTLSLARPLSRWLHAHVVQHGKLQTRVVLDLRHPLEQTVPVHTLVWLATPLKHTPSTPSTPSTVGSLPQSLPPTIFYFYFFVICWKTGGTV